MRKSMYTRVLLILYKKHCYAVIETDVFDSNLKENYFVIWKMLNFFYHFSFYTKALKFGFGLFHLKRKEL